MTLIVTPESGQKLPGTQRKTGRQIEGSNIGFLQFHPIAAKSYFGISAQVGINRTGKHQFQNLQLKTAMMGIFGASFPLSQIAIRKGRASCCSGKQR